jgi:hypothetical protein
MTERPTSPANGGRSPSTFRFVSGSLPPGVTLTGSNLKVPLKTLGTFSFAIVVIHPVTGCSNKPQGYTLTVRGSQ